MLIFFSEKQILGSCHLFFFVLLFGVLTIFFFSLVFCSGKFPISYPKSTGVISQYWHKVTEAANFQWEFGHGLSYSDFQYSGLDASGSMRPGEELRVAFNLRNNGPYPGAHSVLLFLSDEYRQIVPEVKMVPSFFSSFLFFSFFFFFLLFSLIFFHLFFSLLVTLSAQEIPEGIPGGQPRDPGHLFLEYR